MIKTRTLCTVLLHAHVVAELKQSPKTVMHTRGVCGACSRVFSCEFLCIFFCVFGICCEMCVHSDFGLSLSRAT